ncbi:acyltransferase [Sphingomonas sp. AP4-R1]|uniref:acyltransferase family protein n=1 Tax=Sphingomonas sp. AP4-R1 TaxID=2735134 RepID=UPI0014932D5D|nr:acyltransferase [Sphingomonas sp. AP4-R1]QJU58715.1 acyltransferase [Sphingomonas sp. AP4-R1]
MHFPLLDAGRGLAALVVVAHHVGNTSGMVIAKHGHLAVDYFLMLSGFVVAMSYEGRLRGEGGRDAMAFRDFLGMRAKRLYPMIFLGAALATIAFALAPNPDVRPAWIALQFLLIPAMACWVIFPLNAPLWSLFYEGIANVAHGGVIAFARDRTIAIAVGVLGLAAMGIALTHADYNMGFRPGEEWIALVRIFGAYLAGVLLWRLHAAGRLPRIELPAFVAPHVPMGLVLAPLLAPAFVPDKAVTLAALFLCFPASLVCSLVGRERPGSVAAWLGGISYPLYAIHMPILLGAQALGLVETPFAWLVAGLFAVAAAWGVERFVDAPIRGWLKQKKRGRSARPRVVALQS